MANAAPEVNVKGEAVERVYGNYAARRYVVNRRYQRKLIWTLEEKQKFIDSIVKGYPVPIILLAEASNKEGSSLEIIDGMQRLDAIVSFINNRYPVDGRFFDLNTIAVTKDLLDSGVLSQRQPVMDRGDCVRVASYPLPLSIYEFADEGAVDNVFRRINSGGRQLSRQELRSAGSVGEFATAVRRIAAKVRGDDSASDILKLNEMQAISITNKDLDYGINIESVFWVSQGILSRDNVRQSRDEELVADLVAYMVSPEPVASRTEHLDDYFGMDAEGAGSERFAAIENAVSKRSTSLVITDFQRVLDQLCITLEQAAKSFVHLILDKPQTPSPRYFQLVFLALHHLIIEQNLEVKDRDALIKALSGSGEQVVVQEGGRWGAENRDKAISSVVGMIQKAFGPSTTTDPAHIHWINQFQNLLRQSYTEQAAYDFKQGFMTLSGEPSFDESSFEKIMKTCVAISNIARGHKGYVIVGVAETLATASRVEALFGAPSRPFDNFHVVGVEHEAVREGKSLDQFFQKVVDKITASSVSEPLRSYITSHLKSVRYYDKTVYVFEVIGQQNPSLYGSTYYERRGAQIHELEAAEFPTLFPVMPLAETIDILIGVRQLRLA